MTALRVVEVAERLGVYPSTVYRWIRDGELAVVRRGSNWTRVTEQQLQEFLDRYTVPTAGRQ